MNAKGPHGAVLPHGPNAQCLLRSIEVQSGFRRWKVGAGFPVERDELEGLDCHAIAPLGVEHG